VSFYSAAKSRTNAFNGQSSCGKYEMGRSPKCLSVNSLKYKAQFILYELIFGLIFA